MQAEQKHEEVEAVKEHLGKVQAAKASADSTCADRKAAAARAQDVARKQQALEGAVAAARADQQWAEAQASAAMLRCSNAAAAAAAAAKRRQAAQGDAIKAEADAAVASTAGKAVVARIMALTAGTEEVKQLELSAQAAAEACQALRKAVKAAEQVHAGTKNTCDAAIDQRSALASVVNAAEAEDQALANALAAIVDALNLPQRQCMLPSKQQPLSVSDLSNIAVTAASKQLVDICKQLDGASLPEGCKLVPADVAKLIKDCEQLPDDACQLQMRIAQLCTDTVKLRADLAAAEANCMRCEKAANAAGAECKRLAQSVPAADSDSKTHAAVLSAAKTRLPQLDADVKRAKALQAAVKAPNGAIEFPASVAKPGPARSTQKAPLYFIEREDTQTVVRFGSRGYTKSFPVLYPSERFEQLRRLPRQDGCTCYFVAAMHAVLHQPQFADAFVKWLEKRAARNVYARGKDESREAADRRRFGEAGFDMTVGRNWAPDQQHMKQVLDAVRNNRDLLEWVRDVVFISMIRSAKEHAGEPALRQQNNGAAQAALGMRVPNANSSEQAANAVASLTGLLSQAKSQVSFGYAIDALTTVFSTCGLQVRRVDEGDKRWKDTGLDVLPCFVARIPESGETLCFGQHGPQGHQGQAEIAMDGSSTGTHSWCGRVGHEMCYVRDHEGVQLFDGNTLGKYISAGQARSGWLASDGSFADWRLNAMYVCITSHWPFDEPPDEPLKDAVRRRGIGGVGGVGDDGVGAAASDEEGDLLFDSLRAQVLLAAPVEDEATEDAGLMSRLFGVRAGDDVVSADAGGAASSAVAAL